MRKKLISILMVAVILTATIFDFLQLNVDNKALASSNTIILDDGRVVTLPPGVPTQITVKGKAYELNKDLLIDSEITTVPNLEKGIAVYGTPEDVDKVYDNDYDSKSGEWRYLGFDINANKYSNPDFPPDADSGRSPSQKNWQSLDYIYNMNIEHPSPYNEGSNAGEWLQTMVWLRDIERGGKTPDEYDTIWLAEYFHILSPPTEYTAGLARGWHKTSSGKLWYETFVMPPTEKIEVPENPPNVVADFELKDEVYEYQSTGYKDTSYAEYSAIEKRVLTITGDNGYIRTIENNKNPDIRLKEGIYTFTLEVRNNAGQKDTKTKNIKVIMQQEAQSNPIALITSPNQVAINDIFTVSSVGSMASSGAKIIERKWYIGDTQETLIYASEYDNLEEIQLSYPLECKKYFRVLIKDTAGKEAWSNIAATQIIDERIVNAEAKVDIPKITYEGVYFPVTTSGSKVYVEEDGETKRYSMRKAVEESLADYFYEASTDYYEKEGKELNETGGMIYFDELGVQNILFEVEPYRGENVFDTDYTIVKPVPVAKMKFYGHKKENRKIIIDVSETLYHINYPRKANKTYLEITKLDTGQKFRIYEGESINNSIIKTQIFSNLKLNLHFVQDGEYKVKFYTEDIRGKFDSTEEEIFIREDKAPIADMTLSDKTYRETDGQAYIKIELNSRSDDGDIVGYERIRYKYDSDNDNSFADENWQLLKEGFNLKEVPLQTGNIGKYQIEVLAKEEPVGDIIPEFFTDSVKKVSTAIKIIEIDNIAPNTSLIPLKPKYVDVLMLSDNEQVNNYVDNLKSELTSDENYLINPSINTNTFITDAEILRLLEENELGDYRLHYFNYNQRFYNLKDYIFFAARSNLDYQFYSVGVEKETGELKFFINSNMSYLSDHEIVYYSAGIPTYHNLDTGEIIQLDGPVYSKIYDGNYLYSLNDGNITRLNVHTKEKVTTSFNGFPGELLFANNTNIYCYDYDYWYTTVHINKLDKDLNVSEVDSFDIQPYVASDGEKSLYRIKKVYEIIDDYVNIIFYTYASDTGIKDKDYIEKYIYVRLDKNTGKILKKIVLPQPDWLSKEEYLPRSDRGILFEKIDDKYSLQVRADKFYRKYILDSNGNLVSYVINAANIDGRNVEPSFNNEYFYVYYEPDYHSNIYVAPYGMSSDYDYRQAFYANNLTPHQYRLKPIFNTKYEILCVDRYISAGLQNIKIIDIHSNKLLAEFSTDSFSLYDRTARDEDDNQDIIRYIFKQDDTYIFYVLQHSKNGYIGEIYTYNNKDGLKKVNVGFDVDDVYYDKEKGVFVLLNDGIIDSLYKYRVYKYNRGFFEVINKINSHKFSDEGNKYIGFYTYNTINYTQAQLNELANAIKNKGAKVFFATRTNNQTFANQLTLQTGGKYEYFNDFNTDITTFADYIKSQEGDKSTNDKTVYIKKGETIDYTKYFADYEGDSQYLSSGEKWLYIHNPNYFTNNDGFAPFHNKELTAPIKQFNHVGEYFITYKAKDNPKNDNRFDIYRKWSEAKTLKIIVHEGELSIPPEDKIAPLQITIDVSGDLREYHRVDFKINVIKGSNNIDWNSLDISFNTSDYLPSNKPNTLEFSKIFASEGTKTITVRLSDIEGNTVTETKTFDIKYNLPPIADFNLTGDGYRNELGTAKFNVENFSNPTDDEIGTVEYYIESTKYVDNGDGTCTPSGTEYYPLEFNEFGEIELDKIGFNKIKQVVTETYVNGIGLNGEDLDKYRVFKSSEIIKTVNVINEAPQVEYVVTPNIIKVGDNIEHITNITDDTISGDYVKYMFTHDDTYFENSQGKHINNNIVTDEPTEILNKKGKYDFYVKGYDEDGASTDWIHGGQVIVASEPIADFELVSPGNEVGNDVFKKVSVITIENKAYNEDYENTVHNHGIEYMKVEYRNIGDDSYTTIFEGDNMPNYIPTFDIPQINESGIYEVKMTVKSPEGIEATCTKQFTVLDLRLYAELEPSTIYASQSYKIKATLSTDGLGAVAYIPYSNEWIVLDKVNQDSNNKYFEKEITTNVSLADRVYNIEVYGIYPYNNEIKEVIPLTVETPIELTSDIKPIGPTEYIQTIQDNDGNNDYISVPAGEKIKITAEVISPVTVEYVKAQLEGEGEINLSYKSILNIYEGEINIPGTKLDKDYYNLNIETSLPNGNIAINHHKVKINTPINLLPNIPGELISDTTVAIKAETSKYVETLTVTLYKGESFEKTLTMTVDRIIGNKKEWKANYDVPVGLPEGTYIAEFTARTPNGNVEVDNKTFILQSLDLIDLRITNIINHPSYETKYPILYNDPIVPVGYKTGYYITFKINAKGSPDSVKMKITYKGYNKEFEMTKESQNGNDSVWKLEWYADPFTPFGTIINTEVIAQKGETTLNFNNKYGWNGDYLKVIGTIEQDWRIDQEF